MKEQSNCKLQGCSGIDPAPGLNKQLQESIVIHDFHAYKKATKITTVKNQFKLNTVSSNIHVSKSLLIFVYWSIHYILLRLLQYSSTLVQKLHSTMTQRITNISVHSRIPDQWHLDKDPQLSQNFSSGFQSLPQLPFSSYFSQVTAKTYGKNRM